MELCPAVHRTIMVVDVERFGDRRRTNPHQVVLRDALYQALQQALAEAGISWAACHHEDRGDGVLILAPAEIPKAPFVGTVPRALATALGEHNRRRPIEEQVRLRMALHAGEVHLDRHGVTSTAVNHTFRLLDARPLKTALADSPGVLALITSGWFFEDVVRHSPIAHPETFRPVRVEEKETSTVAWVALPDHPYPPDPTVLTAPPPEPAAGPVPQQLPAAPGLFIGRREELAALTHALNAESGPGTPGATVVISAIGGTGGIGKTWLALTWAHRYLHRFPDGQLAVDLRGFSPGDPRAAADVLAEFLAALGVDRDHQPTDPDARAALYRTRTTGKRLLILLDNAATADQVVPLLPGGNSCTVLVTSRHRLPALLTRHSARPVHLDVLPDTEARTLLLAALDDTHNADTAIAAVDRAVRDLIALCGGFPLALGVVSARIRTHPDLLEEVVTDLRDLGLDALDSEDPDASLPTVLSWSVRRLTEQQRIVFSLLGIAPGPDIDLPAATHLIGLSERDTRTVLRGLVDASLITHNPGGRYAMHDLIRDYAASTARDHLAETVRRAALERVVDFYRYTAHTADHLLNPHRRPIRLDPPTPATRPHPLADVQAALAWLDTHHPHLLAAQRLTATHSRHQAVWHLAWALASFHARRGTFHDHLAVWLAAWEAAAHLPDPTTLLYAHRNAGRAYVLLGAWEQGFKILHQGLALAVSHHALIHQAKIHNALAWVWSQRGNYRQALEHARHALDLMRPFDQPVWEARMLNSVGLYAARLGDYDTARVHCQAALALHRQLHDVTEAVTLDSLGYIALLRGVEVADG
jgi:tetratricopeptide (TPR) repeat protein